MQTLKRWYGKLFSHNVLLSTLNTDIAHLLVEHERGNQVIAQAGRTFEQIKNLTAMRFQSLKQNTVDRTVSHIEALKDDIFTKHAQIEHAYEEAHQKNDDNFLAVDRLHESINALELQDHSF